jgi:hypothetical protein
MARIARFHTYSSEYPPTHRTSITITMTVSTQRTSSPSTESPVKEGVPCARAARRSVPDTDQLGESPRDIARG